ncbi:MAG: hypothetical protein WKF33_02420 [Thermoleophilaceae bacterium]
MKVALLGEPETGKSSYLVALYGALVNDKGGALTLEGVDDEVGFLNAGLQAMTELRRVDRTDLDGRVRAVLRLQSPSGPFELDAPDRSGELLKRMINGRRWDEELRRIAPLTDAALLFLHPLRLVPGDSAHAAGDLLQGRGEAAQPAAEEDPVRWDPSLMPADVRAVDLLQELLVVRNRPLPVGIIVSAWDRVDGDRWTPETWVTERVSLLEQYLATNADAFPHIYFGVSAQGLDFEFASTTDEELRTQDPWDRARTVRGDGGVASLAAPLLWLAEQQVEVVSG